MITLVHYGWYIPNCTLPIIAIIALCTSPLTYIEETFSEHLLEKLLTLLNFCMLYPNVMFFGVFEPPLEPPCQQENMKI